MIPGARSRWLVALLTLLGLLGGSAFVRARPPAPPTPADNLPADHAQGAAGIALSARAGLDGYYKDGFWLPVRISVANDGPDVRASLRVASPRDYGSDESIYAREIDLPTQSRREIFLYIPPEGSLTSVRVTLAARNQTLASTTTRLVRTSPTDLIYGVLAGSPSAFNGLAAVDPVTGSAFVAQLDIGDLPPVARGLQALDVLVVSDVDTGALSAEQRAALAGWVAAGGRLLVAGGPTWQKTAAGLSDLIPVLPVGTRSLGDGGPLAAFAASASVPVGPMVAAQGSLRSEAVTLAVADGVPLIVARRSGFGQVVFLAVDPAFAPLRGWQGVEGMFRNILAVALDRPSWARGFHNWSSARDAVNALPSLQLPSALQICGFLGVYLVVIGPLNYLVLKRLRLRELAWVTTPAIVLVFSVATYVTGYQLRGTQATLHQLSVVQVWPDSEQAQVDQLVGLFSPRRATYDLAFAPGFLVRPMPTFGYYSTVAGPVTLQQADRTVVPGLRADVGGVEPFVMQGQVPAPRFESSLVLEAVNNTVRLKGTVTNLSDITLSDAVLLAPGGPSAAQRLGELRPGETRNVSLLLASSRAAQAPPALVLPVLAATTAGGAFSANVAPPGYYDSTIDDILGNANYYSGQQEFRRYSLLSTAIDSYGNAGRGTGVYLAGWTSASPAPAQVLGRTFSTLDSTLYIIALQPQFNVGGEHLTVPPGLMTWTVVDPGQAGSPSPYDTYIYPGSTAFSLRFAPAQSLTLGRVERLTLHLASYGAVGLADVALDHWDYTENTWVRYPGLEWGDTDLAVPGRFVGPGGEILVRVGLPLNAPQLSIERLDYTLVAQR